MRMRNQPVHAPTSSRLRVALLPALLCLSATAFSTTFTISFDAGDPINGLPDGATLSNQYTASTGLTFTSNAFTGSGGSTHNWATNTDILVIDSQGPGAVDLGTADIGVTPVSGNLLHSYGGWLSEDGDPSIRMTLSPVVDSCSATFASVVTLQVTQLIAFDALNNQISVAVAAGAGQQRLTVTAPGIASVAIIPGNYFDWVGVDDISCTRLPDDVFGNGFE